MSKPLRNPMSGVVSVLLGGSVVTWVNLAPAEEPRADGQPADRSALASLGPEETANPAPQGEDPARPSGAEPTSDQPKSEYRPRTLFGRHVEHGGWGGAMVRASSISGDPALFVGGRGGWLIDHHLLLGAAGAGQALNLSAPRAAAPNDPNANLEFGYGGFLLGWHVMPESFLHGFTSVMVGAGGLTLSDRRSNGNASYSGDAVFVVEPEVALEANVLEFMRVQLSVTYRQVLGVDMAGLGNRDLSAFAGGMGLAFGRM